MSVTAPTPHTSPPQSFYGPTPEGFPPLARLSVQQYEEMIDAGLFSEDDRFELIEGTLVQKMTKKQRTFTPAQKTEPPGHRTRAARRLALSKWRSPSASLRGTACPSPISRWWSVRGEIRRLRGRRSLFEDLALVVEVSDTIVLADRAMAATYIGGGHSFVLASQRPRPPARSLHAQHGGHAPNHFGPERDGRIGHRRPDRRPHRRGGPAPLAPREAPRVKMTSDDEVAAPAATFGQALRSWTTLGTPFAHGRPRTRTSSVTSENRCWKVAITGI